MTRGASGEAEAVLDRFVESLFRLMLEHHQRNVAEMEVTLPQAQALKLLHGSPLSTSRLAEVLGISAPAVTQLTDRLVRKQLIERRTVEADRRSVMVGLTKKGVQVIENFRQRRNQVFGEALSRLADRDRMEILGALAKITSLLDEGEFAAAVKPLKPDSPRRPRAERQTAVQPTRTSNEIGLAQASLPPRRRMKIEWD